MTALNIFPMNKTNMATGYGLLEAGLINAFKDIGVDYTIASRYSTPVHDITLVIGFPVWGPHIEGRKWILTMSESNKVSPEWVNYLNTYFERCFVPAPFLVESYRECGVTIPVELVHLGMDFHAPEWCERRLIHNWQVQQVGNIWIAPEAPKFDNFNWLAYSLGDTRKGVELTMMAFDRMFNGDERHHLIIKCRDNPEWLSGLEHPQMTIIRGEQSETDWYALMAKCHAFIFPSRGEGFGYPPRFAVLSGLPTAATEAHGLWDVAEWGYPLPVKDMRQSMMMFPDDSEGEANAQDSKWWEPDQYAIDRFMQDTLDNYPAALEKARKGREYLLSNFKWADCARQIAGWL